MRLLIPALFFLSSCATAPAGGLERIETIVVIYAENRSFDHLYGLFPGANGIADATDEQRTQLDLDGTALPHLPAVFTPQGRSEEHTSELQSRLHLVCRLLLEKKKNHKCRQTK